MTSPLATSEAFHRLAQRYGQRLAAARSAHAAGRPVVGRIGHQVPIEPILAAGCMPVLVSADLQIATPGADQYIDPELPPRRGPCARPPSKASSNSSTCWFFRAPTTSSITS